MKHLIKHFVILIIFIAVLIIGRHIFQNAVLEFIGAGGMAITACLIVVEVIVYIERRGKNK